MYVSLENPDFFQFMLVSLSFFLVWFCCSRKPHVNVGTIGHVDHGKTTLTAAITKVELIWLYDWLRWIFLFVHAALHEKMTWICGYNPEHSDPLKIRNCHILCLHCLVNCIDSWNNSFSSPHFSVGARRRRQNQGCCLWWDWQSYQGEEERNYYCYI